jgi:hypothetical protein
VSLTGRRSLQLDINARPTEKTVPWPDTLAKIHRRLPIIIAPHTELRREHVRSRVVLHVPCRGGKSLTRPLEVAVVVAQHSVKIDLTPVPVPCTIENLSVKMELVVDISLLVMFGLCGRCSVNTSLMRDRRALTYASTNDFWMSFEVFLQNYLIRLFPAFLHIDLDQTPA